jgi:hypothetical protein
MLELAEGPAEAAAELKLARRELREALTEDCAALAELWAEATRLDAELTAEPAEPVAELRAEPAEPVTEARADEASPRMEEAPPTPEVMSPRMEETRPPWAAAPAAKTEVAMIEKRILMVWLSWLVVERLEVFVWWERELTVVMEKSRM